MNLNVRKEVFESLRLELQEFTPQEFVASCWIVTLKCESRGYISPEDDRTQASYHSANHATKSLVISSNGQPSTSQIRDRLTNYDSTAYSSNSTQNNKKWNQGKVSGVSFVYDGAIFFMTSLDNAVIIQSQDTMTPS